MPSLSRFLDFSVAEPPLEVRPARWRWHMLVVVLLALGVGLLFLQEPRLGDDFTYWSFGKDLHERGLTAWKRHSFHDLRWPVWGVCWVLQGIFGLGLVSYYGAPLFYLMVGTALAFGFGRMLTGSPRASWAAAILFLFQPLLDPVCYRPMPDLPESVWGGLIVLCWWRLLLAPARGQRAVWMAALGAGFFLAESNRVTGAFFVPVIGVLTLLYGRRRLGWVLGAGALAALLYAGEAAFYHHLFRDWLHNLHANMGAKGKKGTDAIALWVLPFRFLGGLWDASILSPIYSILACLGLPVAWGLRRTRVALAAAPAPELPLGRIVALWAILLYLTYACAPQSLWPWRPMIRDADRFLAGLTLPLSLLGMLGLLWLWQRSRLGQHRWGALAEKWPALAAAAAMAVLTFLSTRPAGSLGFVPEMRQYLRGLPPGTKVFTHDDMRDIAFLVDADTAHGLRFLSKNEIIRKTPEVEAMAAGADEFWYSRKLMWLTTRKQLELKRVPEQAPLPSYIERPEAEWAVARLLAKGDTPDLVFYRRRTLAMAAPVVLKEAAPEWGGLLPALPLQWSSQAGGRFPRAVWKVPPELRGKVMRLEMVASSPQVEAFTATLRFVQGKADEAKPARSWRGFFMRTMPFLYRHGAQVKAEYLLKPYLHPLPGREFFVLTIPPTAEECEVQLKLGEKAVVKIQSLEASFEDGLEQKGEAVSGRDED